jgi:hypothetical protein
VTGCVGENCTLTDCVGENCTVTGCVGENCTVTCAEDEEVEQRCTFPANWVGSWLMRQVNASSGEVLVFEERLEYNGVVVVGGENKTGTITRKF